MSSSQPLSLPQRFRSDGTPEGGSVTISDQVTGRSCEIPFSSFTLFAKALNDLFGEETSEVRAPKEHVIPLTLAEAEAPTPKKRGRPKASAKAEAEPAQQELAIAPTETESQAASEATVKEAPKKKRGRPRKTPVTEFVATKEADSTHGEKALGSASVKAPAKAAKVKSKPQKDAPVIGRIGKSDRIDDEGFRLEISEDLQAYNVVRDDGVIIGNIRRASDQKKFEVSLKHKNTTKHSSLMGAQVRILMALKENS